MKLYEELAFWWPLLSDPADYKGEAARCRSFIEKFCAHPAQSMLELGCGGGNNALHLKQHFSMTLTDISPAMLAVSRALNPECRHQEGDMRTVRLHEQFDAVFVHDAIMYMTTPGDLRLALDTAFTHCRPGGVALFFPDVTRETFRPRTEHGGHDRGGRGLRYMMWDYDPDAGDTSYLSHMSYVMRDENERVTFAHDTHILGLFARDEWLTLLAGAGFIPHQLTDGEGRDLFVGQRRP